LKGYRDEDGYRAEIRQVRAELGAAASEEGAEVSGRTNVLAAGAGMLVTVLVVILIGVLVWFAIKPAGGGKTDSGTLDSAAAATLRTKGGETISFALTSASPQLRGTPA